MITRFFVDVACDLPERHAGALSLEFANAAVSWVGQIIPVPAIMDGSRGSQRPKPSEQLARPISGIGRESSRLKAEGHFGSIDHHPGCRNLVIGARWRRLDIDDDSVLDIDHVVEPIAKLDTLVRLRSPGGAWIAW